MKYNIFKRMMKVIRNDVAGLAHRGETQEEIIEDIFDMVISTFFWDVENDKPTCNYDQMKIAIQNTVQNLLCSALN